MSTEIAEVQIEFGEITCEAQSNWLGGVVAHFVGRVLELPVPEPAPFGAPTAPVTPEGSEPWDDDIADVRLELAGLRRNVAALIGAIAATDRSLRSAGSAVELEDLDHEEW